MIYVLTVQGHDRMSELASAGEISSSQYLTLSILRQADTPEGMSPEFLRRRWGEDGEDRVKLLIRQGHMAIDYPEGGERTSEIHRTELWRGEGAPEQVIHRTDFW